MAAVEINVIEPVVEALATQNGWIGLLFGLLGRETMTRLRSLISSLRGTSQPAE